MPLEAASWLATLMLVAWGSASAAATAPTMVLVVPSPGSQNLDRWDLGHWEWPIGGAGRRLYFGRRLKRRGCLIIGRKFFLAAIVPENSYAHDTLQ